MSRPDTLKLLKKLPTSKIAELSNLSNAYISQVKHGKRPPSQKLLEAIEKENGQGKNKSSDNYTALQLFLKSRREGISPNTVRDYRITWRNL